MITKKEIDELKKSFELKLKVFNLIKNKKYDKAKRILEANNNILSYFIKFKHEQEGSTASGKVISLYFGGWKIIYNSDYENEIIEDLAKLKKEIEEKENRLEQYLFLKKQQEFIDLQKEDLKENKENRKNIQNFTFVLAFGVIISTMYFLFQIIIEFKKTNTIHTLILSGIFIIFFVLFMLFILTNFKMNKEIETFFRKYWGSIIVLVLIILFLFILLLFVPDSQLNNSKNSETSISSEINDTVISDNFYLGELEKRLNQTSHLENDDIKNNSKK